MDNRFGANIIMFIEVSLALGRQLDPACLSKVRAKAFLVQTLAGKPRAGKQFGWEATEHLGWEATYVLGSTLAGKPSCWEATCWEAPIWLGSHFVGAVVWAGKPPCLGRLRVGGVAHQAKPLPIDAVFNSLGPALTDAWHEGLFLLDCVACLLLILCFNDMSLLRFASQCLIVSFWLGSHLLASTLPGRPFC